VINANNYRPVSRNDRRTGSAASVDLSYERDQSGNLTAHALNNSLHATFFLTRFWATVCKMGSPYAIRLLSVCLSCPVLSCLYVTLVCCGQTVGQIKIKLGTQVGLGPGHIVLDWDPAPC